MSTDNITEAVLAEVAALAADHGWSEVAEFIGVVPERGTRDIAILSGEGVDPGPLAAWIAEQGGVGEDRTTPATSLSALEPLATQPWRALLPNRVVIALRCGRLLAADTVRAASAVTARPAPTYRVVLTGAEDLESAEDLTAIERGLWRVLLAPGGAEWHGQDIAIHGCLLWSDREGADSLRDRVGRDVATLQAWLTEPVGVLAELDRDRAAGVVSLAMDALDARSSTATDAMAAALSARRTADLAAAVRGLHATMLSRLDSDAAATERQVLASLETLGHNLTSGRELKADYLACSIQEWATETEQLIRQRAVRAREDARHLLERADWDLVNHVAPHQGVGYPNSILDELVPQTVSLPAGVLPADSGAPGAQPMQDQTSGLRPVDGRVLVTAGVGAAVLGVLGLPLVPVAGAAALGVIGGSIYGARHRADEARKQTLRNAGAAASDLIASAAPAVRQTLREQAAARSGAVDRQFTRLEHALDEQAERARQYTSTMAASPRDDSLRTRLDALAHELEEPRASEVSSDGSE
jgi:hypothetical protein